MITKLHLCAYADMKGWVEYKSTVDEAEQSLGGGVSVGAKIGGGSVGAEWGKKVTSSKAAHHVNIETIAMPDNSSPRDWVESFKSAVFSNFGKIADQEAWSGAYSAKLPTAPVIPTITPSKPHDPLASLPAANLKEGIRKMHLQEFYAKFKKQFPKKEPEAKDYDDYIKSLADLAKLDDIAINKKSQEPPTSLNSQCEDFSLMMNRENAASILGVHKGYFQKATDLQQLDEKDQLSLGGYGISGYDYTPWEKLLPELEGVSEQLTSSQVSLGYAQVWFSIRGLIGQYLQFCSKYEQIIDNTNTHLIKGKNLCVESNAYQMALDSMIDDIDKVLIDSLYDFSVDVVSKLERDFRDRLKERRFTIYKYYDFIIENYFWLKRIPFGVFLVLKEIDGDYKGKYGTHAYYDNSDQYVQKEDSNAAALLVSWGFARGIYPLIASDINDNPFFIWLGKYPSNDYCNVAISFYGKEVDFGDISPWDRGIKNNKIADNIELARKASECIKIHPEFDSDNKVTDSIWSLQSDVKGNKPNGAFFTDYNPIWLVYGNGLHAINFQNTGNLMLKTDSLELCIVPIDYQSVQLGLEDSSNLLWPMPMWYEPRTDEILEKLKELTK